MRLAVCVCVCVCVRVFLCACLCLCFNVSVGKYRIFVGMFKGPIFDRHYLLLCTSLKTILKGVYKIMHSGVLFCVLQYIILSSMYIWVHTCIIIFTKLLACLNCV